MIHHEPSAASIEEACQLGSGGYEHFLRSEADFRVHLAGAEQHPGTGDGDGVVGSGAYLCRDEVISALPFEKVEAFGDPRNGAAENRVRSSHQVPGDGVEFLSEDAFESLRPLASKIPGNVQ